MMTYTIAVQIMNFNESPVFLLLDDNMGMKHKNLPVNLYESGELIHRMLHIKLTYLQPYQLQTSSANRHVSCRASHS